MSISDFDNYELLASHDVKGPRPFLTVAIPHYGRKRHLEIVLDSIFDQMFHDFEILISDDQSPDDSNVVIPPLLQRSGRAFRYYTQSSNLGYDGNVRFCLAAARGDYVFLLGNDDALSDAATLKMIAADLRRLDGPEVAFTSYADWSTGEVTKRAQKTQRLGSGPEVAVRHFRSFSFVSGLIYKREAALEHETNRWDNSVFYQMYLGSRIVATGGQLAALSICSVRKDVKVENEINDCVARWAGAGWSLEPRQTGLDSVIRVTADAILPRVEFSKRSHILRQIIGQILLVTYPSWLFIYRLGVNWSFAFGIARDMWVGKLLAEHSPNLKGRDKFFLWILYLMVTVAGLIIPAFLFHAVKSSLSDFVRRIHQTKSLP
jgi:glycosyltransferase involved in cell wall biosynthesis